MENKNTAILVDTGTDINIEMSERFGLYLLPLYINYKERQCRDRFDMDGEDLYQHLNEEIPTTSTPSPGEVEAMFDQIRDDGYKNLIIVTISSKLSGIYNLYNLVKSNYKGLNIEVIDTKNIAIGAGFIAIFTSILRDRGYEFAEIVNKVKEKLLDSASFFTLDTLKYLIRGGRIGKVAGTIGNVLNIKPIITCDSEGVYHSADRVRGRKKSLQRVSEIARDFVGDSKEFLICVCNGGSDKLEFENFKNSIEDFISSAFMSFESDISSTLAVHTGPGLIGIGVMKLD